MPQAATNVTWSSQPPITASDPLLTYTDIGFDAIPPQDGGQHCAVDLSVNRGAIDCDSYSAASDALVDDVNTPHSYYRPLNLSKGSSTFSSAAAPETRSPHDLRVYSWPDVTIVGDVTNSSLAPSPTTTRSSHRLFTAGSDVMRLTPNLPTEGAHRWSAGQGSVAVCSSSSNSSLEMLSSTAVALATDSALSSAAGHNNAEQDVKCVTSFPRPSSMVASLLGGNQVWLVALLSTWFGMRPAGIGLVLQPLGLL